MNDQTVLAFRNLGLTEYQSRILAALYESGNLTGTQIAGAAEIPVTKIYSILSQLEGMGVVFYSPQRPKKYRAAEPSHIVSAVMEKKQNELSELKEQAKTAQGLLSRTFRIGEQSRKEDVVIFHPTVDAIWAGGAGIFDRSKKYAYCFGNKEVWLSGFEHEVFPKAGLRALKRGAQIEWIIPESLTSNAIETLKKCSKTWLALLSHSNNYVRIAPDEQIYYGMMGADEKAMGWAFQDANTKELLNGVTIFNEYLARGTTSYFKSVWNKAQQSEKVIRQIALQIIERDRRKSSL